LPHEVRPYDAGIFTTPYTARAFGGGDYDSASGLLYLTLQRADLEQGPFANPPLVLAYKVTTDP